MNTLAYMDQASFLGLRALGRGPLIQFTWIYRAGVDIDGLQQFRRSLGSGMLARRIERSPVPGGRHRWVAWPGPDDIEICPEVRSADQIGEWADEQAVLPVDPEHGPSWRLALLRLSDGGAAVTLVISHTVADGVGAATAVAEAVRGVDRDLRYPGPGSRTKIQALSEDIGAFLRDLPDKGRAVVSLFRQGRGGPGPRGGVRQAVRGEVDLGSAPVRVPSVTVYVDTGCWDARAARLGGTPNSLLMAFAARLASRLGWVSSTGLATLSVPVNERSEGDPRGNALTAVGLTVDPQSVSEDLSRIRSDFRAALGGLRSGRDDMLAALPLIPVTPKFIARRIERMINGTAVVGCSNVGDLDPAVNRPDGTDADVLSMRLTEPLRVNDVRRSGGVFFPVGSGRVRGKVFVTVGYSDAGASTTAARLAGAVRGALDDLGIEGEIR